MTKRPPHVQLECQKCKAKHWYAANWSLLWYVCKACHTMIAPRPRKEQG